MAIKFVPLTCPNCHAALDAPVDQDYCYCSYCGTKIAITDDTVRLEINKTVTHRKINYTKIEQIKSKNLVVLICAAILVGLIIASMFGNYTAGSILYFGGFGAFLILMIKFMPKDD